ncbi:hypothetical protein MMUR_05490 [Mycolicibacterium murale]|uniref:Helix-turn-helix domain-containing protein n=1 Tax=Mycolicibacterium murale TaxID=182220 RepID=A0A7I9WFB0_9MYCO|nr:helix-turn-helix domain-containing protein [Mycolicibacterium murale]MCV7182863.1 helix-turn-helix domain-containing protein [Mycolicibacterium murale]GFG56413.1 hypothetical protein MMUR_05490 [Mycolicibacterium murale]
MIERINGVVLGPDETEFLVRALELLSVHVKARGAAPSQKLLAMTEQLRAGVITGATRRIPGVGNRTMDDLDDPAHAPWHAILDSRRAADILGITPNGARDLARRGALPARRAGREWLFDASAVVQRAESKARR